jgi:phosphatidylglycerophosphate synthase
VAVELFLIVVLMLFSEFRISPQALEGLKRHKYSTSSSSIIDNTYVLPLVWDTLEKLVPRRFSPNSLTFLGFLVDIVGFVPLLYFSSDLMTVRPCWMLGLTAFCMLFYNTCDNIDGRHARALNMGSVIGEIFDHGLDSMTNVCQTLPVMIALQAGLLPFWPVFILFMLIETYAVLFFTRKLVLGNLSFVPVDTTELQYFAIIMVFVTAFAGPGIWNWSIPILNVNSRQFWLASCILSVVLNSGYQLYTQLASPARSNLIHEFSKTLLYWLVSAALFYTVPSAMEQPLLYFMVIAGMFSKLLTELVFSNVGGKPPKTLLDSSLLSPLFLLCNAYFQFFPYGRAVMAAATFSFILWFYYFSKLVYLSSRYLNLPIFTVPSDKLK